MKIRVERFELDVPTEWVEKILREIHGHEESKKIEDGNNQRLAALVPLVVQIVQQLFDSLKADKAYSRHIDDLLRRAAPVPPTFIRDRRPASPFRTPGEPVVTPPPAQGSGRGPFPPPRAQPYTPDDLAEYMAGMNNDRELGNYMDEVAQMDPHAKPPVGEEAVAYMPPDDGDTK